MSENKSKNWIIYWDIFIFLFIILAVGLIFYSYFQVSPIELIRLEKFQYIITIFFIIDFIVRIWFYKSVYYKSFDILIDIISCLDILGPLFKVFKAFKFVRLLRFLKFIRLMRLLKITHLFNLSAMRHNTLFNSIGFSALLIFIILGLYLSNETNSQYLKNEQFKNEILLRSAVENSIVSANNLNTLAFDKVFIELQNNIKNMLAFEIKREDGNLIFNTLNMQKDEFDKYLSENFFKDDIQDIEYKGIKIMYSVKHLNFKSRKIEYITLCSAVSFYIIMFFIFFVHNLYSIRKRENE